MKKFTIALLLAVSAVSVFAVTALADGPCCYS